MTLILPLLVKSTLLFALCGLLLLGLRRASASARHLVCLLTLGALLALPLFSAALPGWRLPVLKEPTPAQAPALPKREDAEFKAPKTPPLAASGDSAMPINTATLPETPRPPASGGQALVPGGFFILYLLGVLLAAVRPLLGLWGIAHLRRACVPAADTQTLSLADECAAALGLPCRPLLCRAEVPVPMTWGGLRPVVLLPSGSVGWPEDRLRAVLLHEMAHVVRRDWAGHRLADLACALYWFHPCVWLVARRLRAESEIACDDLVVSSGIPAAEYARHLLEIAQSLPGATRPPHSAIAMAQTSKIERRITMILDKTHSRQAIARRVLLFALVPSVAALVTLAVLRPMAKAQADPAASTSTRNSLTDPQGKAGLDFQFDRAEFRKRSDGQTEITTGPSFKINGTTLFAGITDANRPGSPWWSASGRLLPTPVYDTNAYHAENYAHPNAHTLSLAFRLPPTASDMTVRYELPQSLGSFSDGSWPTKLAENAHRTEVEIFSHTHGSRVVTAQFPPALLKANIRVGIASSPWKTAASYAPIPGGFGNTDISSNSKFLFSPVTETKDGTVQSVATDATEDLRVVVVDVRGKESLPILVGDMSSGNGNGALDQITSYFSQPLSQIKEIRIQTRPFYWIEFKDVVLQPSASSAAPANVHEGRTESASDAQFGQKEALRLSQAQQIRDHLANWAQANKPALVQMQKARPDGLASLMRVYDSLIKQPLPLWDGDPRVGRAASVLSSYVPDPAFSTQTVALTLSHLERSQAPMDKGIREDFARYRDFRIARSADPGRNSIVVWASGRITQSTVSDKFMGHGKPILSVTSEKTITPPFSF